MNTTIRQPANNWAKKSMNVVNVSGIPLEIYFIALFRAPYLQRDASDGNDTYVLSVKFFELFPLVVLIFQLKVFHFQSNFFFSVKPL